MKSKVLLGFVVCVAAVFFPHVVIWLYENLYSSTKICLSDFLNYSSNVFTGGVGILFSAFALYISMQKEKISIATSKSVIRAFVELSCSGFKENSQGKSFRFYIPNRDDFENHLQIISNANVLNKAEADLCRSIFNYVRSVKKLQKTELKNVYTKFQGEIEFTKKSKQILEKLSN